MKRTVVFPGSFDPITKGHEDVIRRASFMFDEIIVAVGINSSKKSMFPLEKRLHWIAETFADLPNVRSLSYSGLTIEMCKQEGASFILRGLRSSVDFEYERSIAQMNIALDDNIETVILFTSPEYSAINSTIVREIYKNGGDVSNFIPEKIDLQS